MLQILVDSGARDGISKVGGLISVDGFDLKK